MIPESPNGKFVDYIKRCYEADFRSSDGNTYRIRWYKVTDPGPGLWSPPVDGITSSDWDEYPGMDPQVGEQWSTRRPWRDWRDCSPPPWQGQVMGCQEFQGSVPNTFYADLSLVAAGPRQPAFSQGVVPLLNQAPASPCRWSRQIQPGAGNSAILDVRNTVAPWTKLTVQWPDLTHGAAYVANGPWDGKRPLLLYLSGVPDARATWPPTVTIYSQVPDMPLIGSIVPWAGAGYTPPLYLPCQGQVVSRTTYAALFAAIGTTWGAGDGATTFALPDLRDRVPVGAGGVIGALGQQGGEVNHTLLATEMPSHTHGISDPGHAHPPAGGDPYLLNLGTGAGNSSGTGTRPLDPQATTGTAVTGITGTQAAGGGGPHNNLQPYSCVTYLIYAGV